MSKAKWGILTDVFKPVDRLVDIERSLTEAEDNGDIVLKQALESQRQLYLRFCYRSLKDFVGGKVRSGFG